MDARDIQRITRDVSPAPPYNTLQNHMFLCSMKDYADIDQFPFNCITDNFWTCDIRPKPYHYDIAVPEIFEQVKVHVSLNF